MEIKNKWKVFAFANILSDWSGEANEIYDKLQDASEEQIDAIFEDHAIDVWQPFEYWLLIDVWEKIQDIATNAQQIENEE